MLKRVSEKGLCVTLILGMTGVLPGCSFLFTTAPKSAESPAEFVSKKCTTSKAAPIIDTVIAGYQGFRTVYAATTDKSSYDGAPISREADIAFGLGFFTLFTASAIYGYYVTSKCSSRQEPVIVEGPARPEKQENWDEDGNPRPPPPPRQQWNTQPRPPGQR